MKGGFFPVPPEVVEFMRGFLVMQPGNGIHTILDPCCGKGAALNQWAHLLGIAPEHVFAMELDSQRGAEAQALMPKATIVTPADFIGSQISFGSFSVAWVNPPYDDELGGGKREECSFLTRVTDTIVRGGILMLALPQPVLERNYDIQNHLMCNYEDMLLVNYPDGHRQYRETVVFAKRRKKWASAEGKGWRSAGVTRQYYGVPDDKAPKLEVPTVPMGPKAFRKATYCEWELLAAMQASKLKKVFAPPAPKPTPRPGLQLGAGQRALVLAGGFLNRVLEKDDGPILIKASPFKEAFVKDQTEEEVYDERTGNCEIKTTTIVSERICLKIRVLDNQGVIHDLKS